MTDTPNFFKTLKECSRLMDTIKFKLLRVTDQCVHETIRIMKLPLLYVLKLKFLPFTETKL